MPFVAFDTSLLLPRKRTFSFFEFSTFAGIALRFRACPSSSSPFHYHMKAQPVWNPFSRARGRLRSCGSLSWQRCRRHCSPEWLRDTLLMNLRKKVLDLELETAPFSSLAAKQEILSAQTFAYCSQQSNAPTCVANDASLGSHLSLKVCARNKKYSVNRKSEFLGSSVMAVTQHANVVSTSIHVLFSFLLSSIACCATEALQTMCTYVHTYRCAAL